MRVEPIERNYISIVGNQWGYSLYDPIDFIVCSSAKYDTLYKWGRGFSLRWRNIEFIFDT
jgi:hypothetical protein